MKGGHPSLEIERACRRRVQADGHADPANPSDTRTSLFLVQAARARGDRARRGRARSSTSAERETLRARRRSSPTMVLVRIRACTSTASWRTSCRRRSSPSNWRRPTPPSPAGARRASSRSGTSRALAEALEKDAFWAVRAECAGCGEQRTEAALAALLAAVGSQTPSHGARSRRRSVDSTPSRRHGNVAADEFARSIERGDISYLVEGEIRSPLARQDAQSARGRE